MRHFLAAALAAALLLSVAAPVAGRIAAVDLCPNLGGVQAKVPSGYVIVFSRNDSGGTCVPAG